VNDFQFFGAVVCLYYRKRVDSGEKKDLNRTISTASSGLEYI